MLSAGLLLGVFLLLAGIAEIVVSAAPQQCLPIKCPLFWKCRRRQWN